jgi:hypothetical protein
MLMMRMNSQQIKEKKKDQRTRKEIDLLVDNLAQSKVSMWSDIHQSLLKSNNYVKSSKAGSTYDRTTPSTKSYGPLPLFIN